MSGVDAVVAYATIDCNDSYLTDLFGNTDDADMYVGGFANGGNGSGIDAGLQINGNTNVNGNSIQPYLNASAGPKYPYFQYGGSQHYSCNQSPIGIMYGGLPSPDNGTMFIVTGIPSYSPYTYIQLQPNYWNSSAWTFFNTPSDFNNPGTDATGQPSPCGNCITKRMISIAQYDQIYQPDAECFGMCNGTIANRWDQVEMGQIKLPCDSSSSTTWECTITFYPSNSWFGGYQVFPDSNSVQTSDPNANEGYEGINLNYVTVPSSYRANNPAGTFGQLMPIPTPTPAPIPSPTVKPCTKPPCPQYGVIPSS